MKKLPLLLLFLLAPMAAMALPPIEKSFGPVKIHMPMQNVDQVQLYEFKTQKGFLGAETLIVSCKGYGLRAGAVIDYVGAIRMPIVTIQTKFSNKIVNIENVRFGVWYGYDKEAVARKQHRWGIIGSLNLW
jgi:hypothetical protein